MYILCSILLFALGVLMANVKMLRERGLAKPLLSNFVLFSSLLLVITGLVAFFANIANSETKKIILLSYHWVKTIWILPASFLSTSLLIHFVKDPKALHRDINNNILHTNMVAVSILCASFYFMVSIGKLKHATEMEEFFISSGYPAILNYIVIFFECIFSLALLISFAPRVWLIAISGLLFILLGAVLTHVKNGDPIEDSFDAFMQILLLGLLLLLAIAKMKRMRKTAADTYPVT